jgi:hypothetical protein
VSPSVRPLKVYVRRQFETFGRAFRELREPDAPFPNRRQMDFAESACSFDKKGFNDSFFNSQQWSSYLEKQNLFGEGDSEIRFQNLSFANSSAHS